MKNTSRVAASARAWKDLDPPGPPSYEGAYELTDTTPTVAASVRAWKDCRPPGPPYEAGYDDFIIG